MPETTSLLSDSASSTLTKTQEEVNRSKKDVQALHLEYVQRRAELKLVSGKMPEEEEKQWGERLQEASTRVNALKATVTAQSQPRTDQAEEQNP